MHWYDAEHRHSAIQYVSLSQRRQGEDQPFHLMSTERRVTIDTPLGSLLQFRKLLGQEHLSQLFILDVDLLSTSKTIAPHDLLGKTVTLNIAHEGSKRHLAGVVSRFGMQGMDEHKHYHYKMRISPWLWLATKTTDFKIFQNKTAVEVIPEVLGKYGYPMEKKLGKAYRTWEYMVQYNESDYNFVSRLMANEGMYYYFKHAPGQNTLVLGDDIIGSHAPLPGNPVVPFYPPDQLAGSHESRIYQWELAEEVNSGRHFTDDFNFKKPRADLSSLRQLPPGHTHDSGEVYEWPGGFAEYADGENYARIRLEQQLGAHTSMQGLSNHCALAPGYTFSLSNYPREDQNQQYLLVGVAYDFEENSQVSSSGGQGGSLQRLSLLAQPTSRAFNPPKASPKPLALGTQSAWVVGPPGEEIYTDQYGRIKVQFHWDRIGAMDERSSCWMRVLTPWAGPNFGMIHIPRVGFEVLVGFENADPDRPLVLGCLYNAANMPPWGLPANATQSGILTRSSKGGAGGAGMGAGGGDANALRFEDKAGAEMLWLHAQKDQLTEVENDEKKWVGRDRVKDVDRDETNHIGRDRTETVDHDETITVHNNRTERVDHNEKISIGDNRDEDVGLNETISIGKNRTETVGDNETISIGKNRTETVGKNESVTVGNNQTFSVGDNRSKSVGKNESDSIGKNWSINVAKMKTESIGIGAMQNIGIFKMVNIGAAYNLNVGAVMMTNTGLMRMDTVGMNWSQNTGATHSVTAGATFSVTVGAASLVMTADGTITLKGTKVIIDGGQHVDVSAARIDLN